MQKDEDEILSLSNLLMQYEYVDARKRIFHKFEFQNVAYVFVFL